MNLNIEKKKLREYLVLGSIGLLFLGFLYYVFFVVDSDNTQKVKTEKFNTQLPEGRSEPLREKKSAYENAPAETAKEKRMKSLQDYMFALSKDDRNENSDKAYDLKIKDAPAVVPENPGLSDLKNKIQSRETGGNYDELATEYNRLQDETDRLRRELADSKRKQKQAEQLEVMEESYKIASKYIKNSPQNKTESVAENKEGETDFVDVTKTSKEVVSTLADELLLDAPYNYGFNTAVGTGYQVGRNTIRACINEEQVVTNGQRVMLRILEPMQAGNVMIPANHLIAGVSRIQGDRMDIVVQSIEYSGNIIPVNLKVYDTDGINGVFCPGSAELDAVKEGAANIGSGIGTSVSFTRSAGQQIAMDLTRGVMQGGSQYLSKKLRTVKVCLKENYQVLLLPQKN